MKKLRVLVAILALAMVAAACGDDESTDTTAGSDANDLGGREVTIAIENAYLPFNYIDPTTGDGAGWDYEAWDAICAEINCTPVYVEAAWEGMIQAVSDGQFDAAADGITITSDRAEIVDFSDGYINIDQRVLVRIDEERTTDELFADDSVMIASQKGTTNFEVAVELVGEPRVSAFDEFGFGVQAVIAGDADAMILDETAGQGYLGENRDSLKLIGDSLASDELGFIYPKGSDLVGPVNYALEQLKADGTLDSLAAKYFSDAFTITYDDLG